jgi:hypothetical protein
MMIIIIINIPPLPQYVFMVWYLVKHRDKFIISFHPSSRRISTYQGDPLSFDVQVSSTHQRLVVHVKRISLRWKLSLNSFDGLLFLFAVLGFLGTLTVADLVQLSSTTLFLYCYLPLVPVYLSDHISALSSVLPLCCLLYRMHAVYRNYVPRIYF